MNNTVSSHAAIHHDAIYVVATTPTGTDRALRFAAALAHKRNTRLVLVVPENLPGAARGQTASTRSWLVARYERMARQIDQRIHVSCVSGNEVTAAREATPPCATAIVGGRHRWWWPHHEERIAAALRRSGRHVVFVPETADVRQLVGQLDAQTRDLITRHTPGA